MACNIYFGNFRGFDNCIFKKNQVSAQVCNLPGIESSITAEFQSDIGTGINSDFFPTASLFQQQVSVSLRRNMVQGESENQEQAVLYEFGHVGIMKNSVSRLPDWSGKEIKFWVQSPTEA